MNTCRTCAYWYEYTQRDPFPNGYRACKFLRNDDLGMPNGVSVDFDNSYCGGTITTGPYFGCVRHLELHPDAIAAALLRDAESQAYAEKARREPAGPHGKSLLGQMSPALQEHWIQSILKQLLEPSPFIVQETGDKKFIRYVKGDPTLKEEKK